MALPIAGQITNLAVVPAEPDDFRVLFTLDSGETVSVVGRDVYEAPTLFVDAFDIWAFLIVQNTPANLIDRELSKVDPQWEALVNQRKPRSDLHAARDADDARRLQLRGEFKTKRDAHHNCRSVSGQAALPFTHQCCVDG